MKHARLSTIRGLALVLTGLAAVGCAPGPERLAAITAPQVASVETRGDPLGCCGGPGVGALGYTYCEFP